MLLGLDVILPLHNFSSLSRRNIYIPTSLPFADITPLPLSNIMSLPLCLYKISTFFKAQLKLLLLIFPAHNALHQDTLSIQLLWHSKYGTHNY